MTGRKNGDAETSARAGVRPLPRIAIDTVSAGMVYRTVQEGPQWSQGFLGYRLSGQGCRHTTHSGLPQHVYRRSATAMRKAAL